MVKFAAQVIASKLQFKRNLFWSENFQTIFFVFIQHLSGWVGDSLLYRNFVCVAAAAAPALEQKLRLEPMLSSDWSNPRSRDRVSAFRLASVAVVWPGSSN